MEVLWNSDLTDEMTETLKSSAPYQDSQFQVLEGQSRLWEVVEAQLQQRNAARKNPLLSSHLSYTAFLLPFVLKDPKKQPSLFPIKSNSFRHPWPKDKNQHQQQCWHWAWLTPHLPASSHKRT